MENSRFKFRAWDKRKRIMVYQNENNSADYWDGVHASEIELVNSILRDSSYEFMQYTGLKDKNGKEIYEGDICETVTYSGNPFGTIDVVKFSGGAFKLTDIEDALLPIPLDDSDIQSVEVIGNIFEHPHLIGGKHG